ncbi:MAG: hypothetical protein KGZ71_06070 [Desulfobulbaceae bacterium]|nr:hypothetical protein [Desulfobulbaceae bacterium]
MQSSLIDDVHQYVIENIGTFHKKRIERLNKLKLKTVLLKKNPYLFKAKYLLTSEQIIKSLTDAFISSNEETIFGEWLEGLAIHINNAVYGGRKSGIPGIDLEFDRENVRYIVAIKSGPNWGNSSQVSKLISDFKTASITLRTSNSKLIITAVNGCCYGKENTPDKGTYFKYCGQEFWSFISGVDSLYTDLIEPIGFNAKEKNDEFMEAYAMMINKFTKEFANEFCDNKGNIDWAKLVIFNSSFKNKNQIEK